MSSFTRIPNSIIDESGLNPYQYQLFSIIVRKTDGWCKAEDGISLSQFEKLVTFKKPKIISTLKELAELGLITKEKHYNEDKKQYSYSTYRISKRVVTQNNKGSNPELQGVVIKDYKQKKLNTKETNTYNTQAEETSEKLSLTLSRLTDYEHTSKQYKQKLEKEIAKLNMPMSFEEFENALLARGYKYKNFLLAYKQWNKKNNTSSNDWTY